MEFPHATILQAGRYQFAPGETLLHPMVYSRRLIRCLAGKGSVRINGELFDAIPGTFLFMPWGHRIQYAADRHSPMLLSGIHVVPDYRVSDTDFEFGVPHTASSPQADHPDRRDAAVPGLERTVRGTFSDTDRFYHFTEFIVEWFLSPGRTPAMARALGQLFIREVQAALSGDKAGWPSEVRTVVSFVRQDLARPYRLGSLSRIADCSPSTLTRRFHAALSLSPMEWVTRERMRRACSLLSSTGLRVGQIAAIVGVPDPYHFAKTFRRVHGTSAREYRRGRVQL